MRFQVGASRGIHQHITPETLGSGQDVINLYRSNDSSHVLSCGVRHKLYTKNWSPRDTRLSIDLARGQPTDPVASTTPSGLRLGTPVRSRFCTFIVYLPPSR